MDTILRLFVVVSLVLALVSGCSDRGAEKKRAAEAVARLEKEAAQRKTEREEQCKSVASIEYVLVAWPDLVRYSRGNVRSAHE